MLLNDRYSASFRTGLYVLMNELRMCCSIGRFAAASKSSQSGGSRSTMLIAVFRHFLGTSQLEVRRSTASLRVPDASGGPQELRPPGAVPRMAPSFYHRGLPQRPTEPAWRPFPKSARGPAAPP